MVFPREAPRAAVEVMTAAAAAAASSSAPTLPPDRPLMLRGKPRSRLPLVLNAWANQRLVRCVGVDTAAPASPALPPSTSYHPAQDSRRRPPAPRDDGFERIRAKLLDHLREAAGRIELHAVVPVEERQNGEPPAEAPAEGSDDDDDHASHAVDSATFSKVVLAATAVSVAPGSSETAPPPAEELPWNLRTRRSAPASDKHPHDTVLMCPPAPAPRPRSGKPERREATMRRRRPRFSVPLTKEEIDEDIYAFTGRLAARRPKKRPRAVQRQMDMVSPGLFLSEVTPNMYLVADPPPPPPS